METLAIAIGYWSHIMLDVCWLLVALTLLALVVEVAVKSRHARIRYNLWWFILLAALFIAPGRVVLQRLEATIKLTPPVPVAEALVLPVSKIQAIPATAKTSSPVEVMPVAGEVSFISSMSIVDWLAFLWLLGTGFLTLRMIWGHLQIRRIIAQSKFLEDEMVQPVFAALIRKTRLSKRITLRASDVIGAPILYGHWKPCIVLPAQWVGTLSRGEVESLLMHELAHIKRKDFISICLQRFIEILFFFHPTIWLIRKRLSLAREQLCDFWAITRLNEPSVYATNLTLAAERTYGHFPGAALGLTENKSTLFKRVETIMNMDKNVRFNRYLTVGLVIILLASTGLLGMLQITQATALVEAKPAITEKAEETTKSEVIEDEIVKNDKTVNSDISTKKEITITLNTDTTIIEYIKIKYMNVNDLAALFDEKITPVSRELIYGPADVKITTNEDNELLIKGEMIEAPYKELLPKAFSILSVEEATNSLQVSGTPEGIAQFKQLVQVFDQKPKAVLLFIEAYAGEPLEDAAIKWKPVEVKSKSDKSVMTAKIGTTRDEKILKELRNKQVCMEVRTVMGNNKPASAEFKDSSSEGEMLREDQVTLTPRINGDGSCTMYIYIRWLDAKPIVDFNTLDKPVDLELFTIINCKEDDNILLVFSGDVPRTYIISFQHKGELTLPAKPS